MASAKSPGGGAEGKKAKGSWTRLPTGVPGLDEVLRGGLTSGRIYLVEGTPGVGKTTLAFQFLFEGVRHDERVLFVSLSETADELAEIGSSHGWSLEQVPILEVGTRGQREDDTVFHPAERELGARMERILAEIRTRKPTRIVLDSCAELRLLAGSHVRYRSQLVALRDLALDLRAIIILIDHPPGGAPDLSVHALVHGVIRMDQITPAYGGKRRQLSIPKLRGTHYLGGFHPFSIDNGGVDVYPRFSVEKSAEAQGTPASSGLAALDALLGGEGLDRGTSTLLIGPAGAGKSVISTQFAVAAADRGERVAMLLFDENRTPVFKRGRKLWKTFEGHVESGILDLRFLDPAELTIAQFARQLREAIAEDVRLVVVDSVNGFMNAVPSEAYLASQLHALLDYLAARGIVTLLVLGQYGFVGTNLGTPVDVSYLADNVLLLRYFEADGAVRKAISVAKRRAGGHEHTIRELVVEERGVRVGSALSEFRGILSGMPEYVGATGPGGPLIPRPAR